MTIHGDEKRVQMARSVLPAKARARKAARDARRRVHHAVRTDQRVALATMPHDDAYDDRPLDADRRWQVKDNVRRRRNADKIGPLIRWANANADRLGPDPASRRAALRAILPDGIIGDHAMTHIEWEPAFHLGPDWRWWRFERGEPIEIRVARLAEVLHRELSARADGFGDLNRELKRTWSPPADHPEIRPRLLHGLHDVDDFVDAVVTQWRSPHVCRSCRRDHHAALPRVVLEFCGVDGP